MSYYYGPSLVKDGLVLYWDIANPRSYPKTGTTVYDLMGNHNGTLVNSPTFNSSFAGVLQFSGVNDYLYNSSINLTSVDYTIIGATRYAGATRGRMINALANNWLIGHWGATTENYYAVNNWLSSSGAGPNDTKWRIYAVTRNSSNNNSKFYVNSNIKIDGNANGGGPDGLAVARWGIQNSEYSNGQFSFLMAYNRVLSSSEILQNYKAMQGRFSI